VSIISGIRHFCTCRFSANRHHRLLTLIRRRAIYVATFETAHRTNAPYVLRCWHLNMHTLQIPCTLNNVKSFLGAFPSDMLPHSIIQPSTVIVNTDAHTESGTHWLAIHLEPRSSTAFYFDSYALSPYIPDIQPFLRCNCTVLHYNNTKLKAL
jgi:hypothetical protein